MTHSDKETRQQMWEAWQEIQENESLKAKLMRLSSVAFDQKKEIKRLKELVEYLYNCHKSGNGILDHVEDEIKQII